LIRLRLTSGLGSLGISRIRKTARRFFVLGAANVLTESAGLQDLGTLAQFIRRTRARALFLSLARRWLVLLVAILIRHLSSSNCLCVRSWSSRWLGVPVFVDAQIVLHVLNSGNRFSDVLGDSFIGAIEDHPTQCHFAIFDAESMFLGECAWFIFQDC